MNVSFPPGDMLHVAGVDKNHLESLFEDVKYRFPVDPRALHGDMGYTVLFQPYLETEKVVRHRAVRSDLLPDTRSHDTRHDAVLMHIETRASFKHYLHDVPLY